MRTISSRLQVRALAAIAAALILCAPAAPSLVQTGSSSNAGTKSSPTNSQARTGKSATKASAAKLIDINSATVSQLKALPGINDGYAQKIVEGRPYRVKTDLIRKNVIPQTVYDKIASLVIARQATSSKAKASPQNAPAK